MRAAASPRAPRAPRRRRTVTRLVSLAFVGYAAYALLGLAGWTGGSGVPRDGFASGDATSEACAARRARACAGGRAAGAPGDSGGDGSARLVSALPRVVSLALPDPDPASGRSRVYGANHWFHVCEFHFHNHARLRRANAFRARFPSASKESALKESAQTTNSANDGVPVIIVVPTESWLTELTPMTRLLLAASYTDGSSADVHFASPREISFSFAREGQTLASSGTDDEGFRQTSEQPSSVERLRCGWLERAWRVSGAQNALERFAANGALPVFRNADVTRTSRDEPFVRETCEPAIGEALAVGTPLAGDARMGRVKAERGDWLPTDEDVVSVRDAFAGLCREPNRRSGSADERHSPRPENAAAAAAAAALAAQPCGVASGDDVSDTRHLVIYQRDTGRVIEDVRELATRLERTLRATTEAASRRQNTETTETFQFDWRVSVVTHHDSFPPCALRRCLARADALVTPHGFQSMLYLFLPARAHVHEVFPHRYYKHGYKRAALEWGVSYGFSMSPPRSWLSRLISRLFTTDACMRMYYCRFLARKGDVVVTDADAALIARSAVLAARRGTETGKGNAEPNATEAFETFAETRWHTSASEDSSRAECLAACAGEHGCQLFAVRNGARCALRTDEAQGEKDGDVLGAGIYNNKCYVPGC